MPRSFEKKVAVPAILYGCELLPMRLAELKIAESSAASVGKYMLNLTRGSSNLVSPLAAGLRTMEYHINCKFMQYNSKIVRHDVCPWVAQTWMIFNPS